MEDSSVSVTRECVGRHTNHIVQVGETVVRLRDTELDRGNLISALVRSRYSADRMEALVNNYLADKDAYQGDFDEMQAWRGEAKRIADECMAMIETE